MGTIEQGVRQAVENCLKVQPGEKALIITDQQTIEIGSALRAAIEKIAGEVEFFVMEDFGTRPIDLPPVIDDAMRSADVSVYAAQGVEGELQTFRMPILKAIEANPTLRHAHMVGITPRIMCDGMCSDYKEIQRIGRLVYEKVSIAESIVVTTEKGCNFTARFSPELKWQNEDGDIKPGRLMNLPDGEVCTCPIDVNGTAVIDGCLGDFFAQKYASLEQTPIIIEIENGRAIRASIECADEQLREEFTEYLFENGENSNRIGEFAIGTNTCLTELIYEILQDEKFPGVHIAFGSPIPSQTGADWDCKSHVDGVINSPTIIADGVTIMQKGQFRLE
ncbi:MAG: aminopeptidase [Planctomycetes bacterium B3_Pla]|nr:MAG: aminopeptidase [Planctomycetes bacterium B3_Pla]